jgi:predicted extracellular nuclease
MLVILFTLPLPLLAQSELFISEYIEGSSYNKAIEIFNGTGASIDLASGSYTLEMYFNGSSSPGLTINLTGTISDGDVFVIAHSSADAAIIAEADQQNGSGWFNGDDAVVLLKDATIIDVIGQVGTDPGSEWGSGLVSTQNNTLRRKSNVIAGDTDETDTFDPSVEWDGYAEDTFDGLGSHTVDTGGPATFVFINEVDSDTPGTDALEFIEIYDGGVGNTALDSLVVVFYNGSDDASYEAFDLDGYSTDANGFFLMGNPDVVPTPSLTFPGNTLQNGADAVAIHVGDAADYPTDTPVSTDNLVDAIVYDTDDSDDAGLLILINSGQPQVNEDGENDKDNHSNSRVPDGGVQLDTDTYVQQAPTPGASNVIQSSTVVINEIDSDTPGTDALEFIELYDGGLGNTPLDSLVLVLYNGNGDVSYAAYDLDGYSTDVDGYFLIGNPDVVPTPSLTFSGNTLQNGADAAALYFGDAADFPNGTAVTASNIIDAIVYDTDDSDDSGLLDVLTPGQSQVNEAGAGDKDNHSNARVPNGGDPLVTSTYVQQLPTPGASNVQIATDVVINELDSDTPSSDVLEFIELFDGGTGNTSLDGLVLVLFNGNGDVSYSAFDLDGYTTDANGYFLMGNSGVTPTPGLIFGNGVLQNGADAAALYEGDADDFPNGTAVTTNNLVDAIVYDTDDDDDSGLLILLNSGEPQVNENSAGDKDNHSNQRIPNGDGGKRNTSTYGQYVPTPGAENVGPPPPVFARIYEIQGSGLVSPFADSTVITAGNVVTGVTYNGFFMMTQIDSTDNDPETSDGIFVYTGSTPTVAVGDLVNVTGTVTEYYELTEIIDVTEITVTASGITLPSYIVFDENTPSPNQPQPANAIERYEGMLVRFSDGIASGPTDQYGDVPVIAGPDRAYREPGIVYPGLPGLPVWDGNPEVFYMNPDALGFTDVSIPAEAEIINAEGVLTYAYGEYTLLPSTLTYSGVSELVPVRAKEEGEVSIATQNMYRLFEGDSDFNDRLIKLSLQIREVLGAPEILAVQEVENLSTLQALANRISTDDPSIVYTPYLEEGNDVGGIDVGFMVRSSVVVDSVTQIGKDVTFSYDGSLLHDRPPLILEADIMSNGTPFPITVMVIHNRSFSGIDGSDSTRVRLKRYEQAYWISERIQELQTDRPDIHLVVTGDFNAYQFTDGYADILGQLTGNLDSLGALLPGVDIVNPNLTNQVTSLSPAEQYSYSYEGDAQVLDHILTSSTLEPFFTGAAYSRGNSDVPYTFDSDYTTALRCSDHDGLVLFLQPPDQIANTVIFATNSVWLKTYSKILSGNVFVNNISDGHELNAGVEVSVGSKVTTPAEYEIKANRVKLKKKSVVDGDVYFNELDNKGAINGDEISPLELPILTTLPEFYEAEPGNDDVKVGTKDTLVIDAGNYEDINVYYKGVLIFTGGTYNVKSIKACIRAKLLFLAPTEIRVEERFDSDLLAYIGPSESASIGASDIIFYVEGTDKNSGWVLSRYKAVQIGISNTVFANFYAPNGTIWITLKSKATGAFWAKNVQVGVGTELSLDSYFNGGDVELPAINMAKNSSEAAAETVLPEEYMLEQNYPNPFNPSTTINFQLPVTDNIRIDIYNSLGQLVKTLVKGEFDAGYHQAVWNGRDNHGSRVASGMYIYRFQSSKLVKSYKMILLK